MIPQFIYIILTVAGLCLSAHRHGRINEKKENFWTSLLASVLVQIILYWGGFFDSIIAKLTQ